jgi:predicted DNA-binding antitoxin AbrB/MazE fold protein
MKSIILFFCITYFPQILPQIFPPKKITIHAAPVDAVIYEISPASKELKQLGVGIAVVEIPKNSAKTIILRRSGFAELRKVYSTQLGAKLPKEDFLTMKDREVALKVLPADATVIANGVELEKPLGNIVLKEGDKVIVEVKKTGYLSVNRTYANLSDADPPPAKEEIKLKDRVIQVVANPSDASILADNQTIGSGHGDVVIPFDKCVTVKVTKPGFVGTEKSYCNKEGITDFPSKETFSLLDRSVLVKTIPNDAEIKINGKIAGKGEFNVKVAKGECVEVIAEKAGYISFLKNYCNQDNSLAIPLKDSVELVKDESFTLTAEANFVNINNIIEINSNKKEAEAWKAMSKVVMDYFDVLEITDMSTGYLRTAWVAQSFPNNTIRMRLIVRVANSNTPKYVVKLVCEESGKSGSNINNDILFSECNRVLTKYKDIITDIQNQLK